MKKLLILNVLAMVFLAACSSNSSDVPASDMNSTINVTDTETATTTPADPAGDPSESPTDETDQDVEDQKVIEAATLSQKTSDCEKIKNADNKEKCMTAVEESRVQMEEVNIASGSGQSLEDVRAITVQALQDKSVNNCSTIEDVSLQLGCKNDVLTSLASENSDISYCDQIGDSALTELCKENVN